MRAQADEFVHVDGNDDISKAIESSEWWNEEAWFFSSSNDHFAVESGKEAVHCHSTCGRFQGATGKDVT